MNMRYLSFNNLLLHMHLILFTAISRIVNNRLFNIKNYCQKSLENEFQTKRIVY